MNPQNNSKQVSFRGASYEFAGFMPLKEWGRTIGVFAVLEDPVRQKPAIQIEKNDFQRRLTEGTIAWTN